MGTAGTARRAEVKQEGPINNIFLTLHAGIPFGGRV